MGVFDGDPGTSVGCAVGDFVGAEVGGFVTGSGCVGNGVGYGVGGCVGLAQAQVTWSAQLHVLMVESNNVPGLHINT